MSKINATLLLTKADRLNKARLNFYGTLLPKLCDRGILLINLGQVPTALQTRKVPNIAFTEINKQ
jgi:hypothetical protein